MNTEFPETHKLKIVEASPGDSYMMKAISFTCQQGELENW